MIQRTTRFVDTISGRRKHDRIEEIKIVIDEPSRKWHDLLQSVLPVLNGIELTRHLDEIRIGDSICDSADPAKHADGIVYCDSTGVLPDDIARAIVENTRVHVLAHEIIHSAHMGDGFDRSTILSTKEQSVLSNEVSFRASRNKIEAVAEIGSGIMHGYEYPEEVHQLYEQFDGPPEVYDLPKPLSECAE